jgi:alpha-N-arabinofuranosidase
MSRFALLILTVSVGIGLVAALATDAAIPVSPDNLLPDGSFEQMVVGQENGWYSQSWNGSENAQWLIESTGKSGRQSLAIRSDKGSDVAWSTKIRVQPQAFYRLSGWIRTESLRGAAGALLNIQNLQHVKTAPVAGTQDWTHVSVAFNTGVATELEVNCLFGGWGSATGRAWYDDVVLEPLAAQADQLQALVTIDSRAAGVNYSPMLFGGFIEHFDDQVYGGLYEPGSPLSDAAGFRTDVVAALKELKLAVVRWPGGCFASGYHWQAGVGRNRQPVPDPVWGETDPNTFGTREFVAWCRLVGCEPYICTNAGNGTPAEMQAWVEYCNATEGRQADARREHGQVEPLNVRYWSIGNENWGGHEIGARTPLEWGPLVLESAELMRQVDSQLTLLAAATPSADWTLPLLKTAGHQLNYVAIHEYWLPCWGDNLTPDYLTCVMHADGPETTLNRVIALLDDAGCRGRVKIAFDEWNLRGWHHPGFPRKEVTADDDLSARSLIDARQKNALHAQYTMADAVFSASFLNACLRHANDVGMANIAPIVNTRGPLFVHSQGIVKRTTFHVLAMYSNLLGGQVVPTEVASIPLQHGGRTVAALDAVATKDAAGKKWRIALTNRCAQESLACAVRIGDVVPQGVFRATILDGDSPEAFNDLETPDRVVPRTERLEVKQGRVLLPPHSVTVLEIE